MQHKAAARLERLQHHRAWNVIKLEHQQAARVAAEGGPWPPAAASSTGCTSAVAPGLPAGEGVSLTPVSGDGQGRGAAHVQQQQQQQKQGGGEAGVTGPGMRQTGVMLDELSLVKSSLRQRANRPK